MRFVNILFALTLILSACSATPQAATPFPSSEPTSQPVEETTPAAEMSPTSPQTTQAALPSSSGVSMARTDEQGAVVVEVTPENLATPGESLQFNVDLNTHSVDLSMDLAALSTLTTDAGITVQASQWDAPLGGHHVSGRLIFPATVDGQPVLKDAKKLTLTINNLDVPERAFSWELNP